jgi:hypothetical protein
MMIAGNVLMHKQKKTITHILAVLMSGTLTFLMRPFKDDFANTMVLMFSLVKFLGIISGVNAFLQVLFVVVSFVILLVVGTVTIKGAHASIVKNQKLKSLTDKHKKSQFTPCTFLFHFFCKHFTNAELTYTYSRSFLCVIFSHHSGTQTIEAIFTYFGTGSFRCY